MPVSNRTTTSAEPDKLRPYAFHGVHFSANGSPGHVVADCPFCGKEGKFSVDVVTGLWRCWVCGAGTVAGGGNGLVFTRLIWETACNRVVGVPEPFRAAVAKDRKLLLPNTVAAWGVCQARDGAWLVPGYGTDGKLDQVYRRVKAKDSWQLRPTPGIWPEGKVHHLHLPAGDFDPERPNIIVCEGPWDGMALWEVWQQSGMSNTNIIAVPGCSTWRDEWTQLCKGKCVTLLYDSDHPPTLGGYKGMMRAAKRLSGVAASVRYLRWGPDGYHPERPNGWDVRDELSTAESREDALKGILARVEDAPREWFNPQSPIVNGQPRHGGSTESLPCSTFAECEGAWKAAMMWRQEMGDALAILLAVCASTQQAGNQLFLDLVGSPGIAKTTLCRGLLVSGNCIHVENMTKVISGWKKPGDETKDCSFIARSNGKTWITCEFDTLGQSPQYKELMGKVRRIFDGEMTATYGNSDEDRVYTALRTPWIRASTPKMMDHDQSSLGDRFMRFIISDPIESDKRDIARRALRAEREAMVETANAEAGSIVDPLTRRAQALTGGYVDWLRANADDLLSRLDVPTFAEDVCLDLAELSADLRARPHNYRTANMVSEPHDCKELPTRLARQNIRLASCISVSLNKFTIDTEVLRIVRKVAMDTAAGHSMKLVQWLCGINPHTKKLYQESGGLMNGVLEQWTGMPPDRLSAYLNFLRKIEVLEMQTHKQMGNSWVLTERVYNLYQRIQRGV